MIGLATASIHPELSGGEHLLFEELARCGTCRIIIWDDPRESWRECDQIIIRTTWDYSWRLPEFLKWIECVERAGIRLHNPPATLRWNMDKRYLLELQERGVEIPETTWIPHGTLSETLLKRLVSKPSVLKPAVSAGAYDTFRVSTDNIPEVSDKLKDVARHKDLLLQEFVPEILTPGEYSLIFFRGEYSHAVLKRPAAGDYRVQPRYGGQQEKTQVDADVVDQAQKILLTIPFEDVPLYARVDGVLRDGRFILMELELVEPYLFLECQTEAVTHLASYV